MTSWADSAVRTDTRIAPSDKGFPSGSVGMTFQEFLVGKPTLDEFSTPLLVLRKDLIDHNISTMAAWTARRGFELMPHGKTTMAPALWRAQLAAGATGITVATIWQAQIAATHGAGTVMLANTLVDPVGLRWLTHQQQHHPFQFFSWVDSVQTVERMESTLRDVGGQVDVFVEMGAPGGRTGARTTRACMEVAARIDQSPMLRLRGVAGYEGAFAHDRSPESLTRVRDYLQNLRDLHIQILQNHGPEASIVTAGGSAYFDQVAHVFSPYLAARTDVRVVLRSGAYITHDEGFYAEISPLAQNRQPTGLRAALRGLSRVISRPEPGLAILDGGKRDFPYDEGLPRPLSVQSPARVTAVNDQHAFMTVADSDDLAVGDLVILGLSHPCTAFDKWRLIPVVNDWTSDAVVVDLVETAF